MLKNDDVYVNTECFQFITDFRTEHGFKDLSIMERVMLSAFLTLETSKKTQNKVNLLEPIFNFAGTRTLIKTNSETLKKEFTISYLYDFITQMTTFIKNKSELLLFVQQNATKLDENGRTVIRRTQINKSQFKLLLDNFKVQRNFLPWISALYVLGCAKASIPTQKLNVISLDNFYKNNTTLAKAKIKQLFSAMGYVEKTETNIVGNYSFSKDNKYCYFGVGFSKALEEQFYSEQKTKFDDSIQIGNILSSFNTKCVDTFKVEEEIPEEVEEEISKAISEEKIPEEIPEEEDDQGAFDFENVAKVDDMIAKYDDRPKTYLDLGDQRRFNVDLIDRALNYGETHPGYFSEKFESSKKNLTPKQIHDLNNVLLDNGKMSITGMLKDYCNLSAVLRGGDLGPNWKQIKDAARNEQTEMKISLCNKFNKLYDRNIDMYWYVVWYILARHKEALKQF